MAVEWPRVHCRNRASFLPREFFFAYKLICVASLHWRVELLHGLVDAVFEVNA